MEKENTWTVVQFEEDDTVEAVPTSWIEGDQCLWPPYTQDKTTITIKNCDINTHWPSHKIRIFKNATYSDYTVARAKARRAEVTSDLNCSDMESKRKSKKPKAFISSSDSEGDDSSSNNLLFRKQLLSPPKRSLQNRDFEKTPCNRKEQESRSENNTPVMSLAVTLPKSGSTKGTELFATCNNSCICCRRGGDDVKRTLFVIKNIACDILEKVNNLSTNLEHPSDKEEVPILNQVGLSYPLTSLEDLRAFDTFYKNEEKYNYLVKMFSKMGGSNPTEYVKRCLAPIISDKIAEKYSFLGRKEKENFSILTLPKAVIDAAEKTFVVNNRKECENAIALWLKRAKARLERQVQQQK